MKLNLVVLTAGKQKGKKIPIRMKEFLIGRDADCHLRFPSPMFGNRHCLLSVRGGQVFVRELGSRNGTYVNEVRIQGEVELHDQDRLRVGFMAFGVCIEPGPAKQPAAAPAKKPPAKARAAATPAAAAPEQKGPAPSSKKPRPAVPAPAAIVPPTPAPPAPVPPTPVPPDPVLSEPDPSEPLEVEAEILEPDALPVLELSEEEVVAEEDSVPGDAEFTLEVPAANEGERKTKVKIPKQPAPDASDDDTGFTFAVPEPEEKSKDDGASSIFDFTDG